MVLVRSRQEDGVPAAAAFPDVVDLDLVEDAGMSKLIFSVSEGGSGSQTSAQRLDLPSLFLSGSDRKL